MKTVRCKMTCDIFSHDEEGSVISFSPVVSDNKNSENDSFFKYTPGGSLNLSVVNPDVVFEEGKEYYVDISVAE